MTARLIVLASGSGSTLEAVISAVQAGDFNAEVVAAGTDRPDCLAMKRAAEAGVPTFTVDLYLNFGGFGVGRVRCNS